jgi:hypothetical protein
VLAVGGGDVGVAVQAQESDGHGKVGMDVYLGLISGSGSAVTNLAA